jgi:hypothetical protein
MNTWTPISYYLGGTNSSVDSTTASTILSFRNLPAGWDYGIGGPLTGPVIQSALEWNSFLLALPFSYTDAFPGGSGELSVAAGRGDYYIEVVIEPDAKAFSVAYDFKRKQVFYRLRKSREEAQKIVLDIVGEIWSAYTLLTHENIIQSKISGAELLSRIIRVHYQSLGANASTTQGFQSANISVSILETSPPLPANHPFFGSLKQTPFQMEVV